MKINLMKTGLASFALMALLSAIPAKAQTYVVRFDIPFQFVAGDKVLAAGNYEVQLDQFARIVLRKSTETAPHFVRLPGNYEKRSSPDLTTATLRFDRYAGTMYLTAAWAPGHEDGRTVLLSEKLLEARNAYGNPGGVASVTLDSEAK